MPAERFDGWVTAHHHASSTRFVHTFSTLILRPLANRPNNDRREWPYSPKGRDGHRHHNDGYALAAAQPIAHITTSAREAGVSSFAQSVEPARLHRLPFIALNLYEIVVTTVGGYSGTPNWHPCVRDLLVLSSPSRRRAGPHVRLSHHRQPGDSDKYRKIRPMFARHAAKTGRLLTGFRVQNGKRAVTTTGATRA